MKENTPYRAWEEVSLSALRENFQVLQRRAPGFPLVCVVKANAYGTGAEPVAETLKKAGADTFAVATLAEAEELLKFGMPIQILGEVLDFELPEAVANNVILCVTSLERAEQYSAEAVRQGRTLECHFKLDTGMGRIGILCGEAPEIIRKVRALPGLNCCGIYSHFPMAYTGEDSFSAQQVKKFLNVLDSCNAAGITFDKIHFANSSALTQHEDVLRPPFNSARAGLALYGAFDRQSRKIGLQNIVSVYARILTVRTLAKGAGVGYERTCILEHDTPVAVISAGYADGVPLGVSNRGRVLLNGCVCPILGRVSMDCMTVSLENVPESARVPGAPVTLIGKDGGHEITVEEWAACQNTHAWDILCGISTHRVPRVYH